MTKYTCCQLTCLVETAPRRVLSGHYGTYTSYTSIPYRMTPYLEAASHTSSCMFIYISKHKSKGLQDNWFYSLFKDVLNVIISKNNIANCQC